MPVSVDRHSVTHQPYILSFSAGGLLYHESVTFAEIYDDTKDWDKTITRIQEDNLLQSRVESTTTRKIREISTRLKELTEEQLGLLCRGSRIDQNQLLWLACCKRYQLLGDFANEVLHNKFLRLDLIVSTADVEHFFETKSVWHAELENLAETTRQKLITVIMRMLREADMVSAEGLLKLRLMSPELVHVIAKDSHEQFRWFPVAEADVLRLLDRSRGNATEGDQSITKGRSV